MAVVEEISIHNGIADVLAIDRKLIVSEIEVKVDKDDLLREVTGIRIALDKLTTRSNRRSKVYKHTFLLNKVSSFTYHEHTIVPNRFYFAVPDYLLSVAISELNHTPYGLINLNAIFGTSTWHGPDKVVVKRADRIHSHPMSSDNLIQIIMRASIENYRLISSRVNA